VLRSGRTEAVLGHRAMAPSTLGTFLRSFTFGHVRQLDPPTRTVIGTTRCPRGWMANVCGVKPMTWSTRLGMTELKKVSSTRCAEAVAGASRKAAMTRAGQRIK